MIEMNLLINKFQKISEKNNFEFKNDDVRLITLLEIEIFRNYADGSGARDTRVLIISEVKTVFGGSSDS